MYIVGYGAVLATRVARMGAPGRHSSHCRRNIVVLAETLQELFTGAVDAILDILVTGADVFTVVTAVLVVVVIVVAGTCRGFQTAHGYTPTRL